MNQPLYAGYLLPGVANVFKTSGTDGKQALATLRQTLCSAAVEMPTAAGKPPPADPVILTAANIVSRGLPTLPSSEIQEEFDRALRLTQSGVDDQGRIQSSLVASHRSTAVRLHAALRTVYTALSPKQKKGNGNTSSNGKSNVLEDVLRESGAEVAVLLFSPLLMARIQRMLLNLLLSGALDLSADHWRLTVVERDVPGGALAIADLRALLDALFTLEGKGRRLPEIKLTVLPAEPFTDSPLHRHADATIAKDAQAVPAADCSIDVAMLSLPGTAYPQVASDAAVHVTLRTADGDSGVRNFHTGEAIAWAPITEAGKRSRSDAALHLLRRLFRLNAFREPQLRLLDPALRQRSMLVSLPAGAGKSLIHQFAALLQPARSLIIVPQPSLAIEQEQSLRDCYIDGVACLHESLSAEQRQREIAKTQDGTAFCTIMTAELFRDEKCTDMLQELRSSNVFFSQCVIDEAHTLSEWSHDSRFIMYGLVQAATQRLRGGKKAAVPIRLFTAAIARDVIEDLRRQCAEAGRSWRLSDEDVIVERRSLNPATHYTVFPSPVANAPEELLRGKLRAFESLLQRLPSFFAELQSTVSQSRRLPDYNPSAFFSRDAGYAGVVFCPRPSGMLGVTSKFSPSGGEHTVVENLAQAYLRVGAFVGKEEGVGHVGRQVLEEAAAERSRLAAGEINLLVATGAYGIGIDNQRIRYTVHLTPPPSIERFVQESARAGHDGGSSLAAVLYTPGKKVHHADAAIAENIFAATNSTAAREKQHLRDLLHEISYPEDSNTGLVANMIEDEFGINVRVSYWQRGLDERMYVHGAGYMYGFVDLVTQGIVPDPAVHDAAFARSILQFAHDASLAAAGSGPTLSSWVSATFPSDMDDGIAQQMAEFDPDATFTLRLGFENDREPLLNQIHQLLWHEADIQIQRKLLSQVSAQSWPDFRSQLEMRSRKAGVFGALDAALEERLIALFNRIRTRADTERVIQRLAMLGAVKDYTINAAARKFSLTMQVCHDGEYRESLRTYMATFVPEAHVERLFAGLPSYTGDSELERCLYFLVDFTYQQPVRRRQEAIAVILSACEEGAREGAASFRSALDLSLRAKYAQRNRLPRDLERGEDRFALLETYLTLIEEDASGSMFENAVHLESSCAELRHTGVDDPLLDALSAFTKMLRCRTDAQISAPRAQFIRAVTDCAAVSGISGSKYIEAVTPLFQLFRRYFSQDVTSQLRKALEDAAENIRKSAPRSISASGARAKTDAQAKMPDLTTVSVPQPTQGKDSAAGTAVTSKGREQAERKTDHERSAKRKDDAQDERNAEMERGPERRSEAKETHRGQFEEDTDTDTDIEAILADLERSLDSSGENRAANRSSRTGASTAESASTIQPMDNRKHPDDSNTPSETSSAPEEKQSAGREDAVRNNTGTIPAAKGGVRKTEPVAKVDIEVDRTLTWLQTFNNRFLKDYESRNARIPAGS